MTFSCTTALCEALARDVPKGLTLGNTQKDSVEGTVREQSGPIGSIREVRNIQENQKGSSYLFLNGSAFFFSCVISET